MTCPGWSPRGGCCLLLPSLLTLMRWTAVGAREGTAYNQWLKCSDFSFHLKEGVRRMRLRGREDMVVVLVVDREEGEGFSENLVKM